MSPGTRARVATVVSRWRAPLVVAALGLLATLAAFDVVWTQDRAQDAQHFRERADAVHGRLNERLIRVEEALHAARALFAASREVEADEWSAFVDGLDLLRDESPVRGLAWIAWAPGPAGPSAPVRFRSRGIAFDGDVWADPAGRAALERSRAADRVAMATGTAVAPPTADEGAGPRRFLFLALPVWRKAEAAPPAPAAAAAAAREPAGWVGAVVEVDALARDASPRGDGVDLEVFPAVFPAAAPEGGAPAEPVWDEDEADERRVPRGAGGTTSPQTDVPGRAFTVHRTLGAPEDGGLRLRLSAVPGSWRSPARPNRWWLLALGLALTGLLAAIVSFVTQARARAERIAAARTAQLERQARELAAARDVAEAATRAKGDFLAVMSHEIRTPIHGVVGMTQLLLGTELDALQREYAETVRDSAEALRTLLDDILDVSRLEAGRMTLEPAPFDLRVAAEQVLDLLAPRAAEKGIDLSLRWAPGSPTRFVGDPGRLRQVLVNLVGNAVKFTDRGSVLLDVEAAPEAEGRARVRVRVVDSGIGIPADKLPLLFAPFTQVDASTTRRFGGSGLGLSIVKALVERMGGTVAAESEEGRGSTFRFEVPLPLDAAAPPAPPAPDVSGQRVLVVDDLEVNRRVALEQARAWGLRPEAADSAEAGLAALRAAREAGDPHRVAVVDLAMPRVDGFGFADAVRADPALRATPLLLLTSSPRRGDGAKALAAGFAGYLPRPVHASDLLDAIRTLAASPGPRPSLVTRHSLAEARRGVADGRAAARGDASPATGLGDSVPAARSGAGRPGAGPAGPPIRVLLAEDNVVNQRVAARLLERLGCTVDVAADGATAVERAAGTAYDLVFMDCRMPGIDGFAATEEIRRREPPGRRVPIVAMTANALEGERDRCLASGMDDHLSKPAGEPELRAVLARWVPRPSATGGPPVSGS